MTVEFDAVDQDYLRRFATKEIYLGKQFEMGSYSYWQEKSKTRLWQTYSQGNITGMPDSTPDISHMEEITSVAHFVTTTETRENLPANNDYQSGIFFRSYLSKWVRQSCFLKI